MFKKNRNSKNKIQNFLKYFLLLFFAFQLSFASHSNQDNLNNITISIIEECINSNSNSNKRDIIATNLDKSKCKNPKFIKENLIKKGYKFDNKTLKNSINLAINSLENKNKFNSNLTKSNEIALSFKQNIQTDDNNKTNSLNSKNKANLKDKISISFSSSENSNLGKNENLDNKENLYENINPNSSNLNIDNNDTIRNNTNYQTIQIKDKNLSNDITFLIGSNSISSLKNNQDNVLPNLLNKNTQIYTQRHGFGPIVVPILATVEEVAATYGIQAGIAFFVFKHGNIDYDDLMLRLDANGFRAEFIFSYFDLKGYDDTLEEITKEIKDLWQFSKKTYFQGGISKLKSYFEPIINEYSFKYDVKTTSAGNMQKQVEQGKAPKTVDRVDKGRGSFEQDHIHFKDRSALNKDGTWKHGSRDLTNAEKNWLKQNGWSLPR